MTIEYVIQQLNNIMGPDFEWKYMPENLKFSDEIDVDVYIITHATNPVYICSSNQIKPFVPHSQEAKMFINNIIEQL
jgi:hypothetical protein